MVVVVGEVDLVEAGNFGKLLAQFVVGLVGMVEIVGALGVYGVAGLVVVMG